MANDLTQDPLVVDTTATNIPCERINGIVFDASGTGSVSIVDATTSHVLFSTDASGWYGISLTLPIPTTGLPLINVTISSGVVYIYLGSGPR